MDPPWLPGTVYHVSPEWGGRGERRLPSNSVRPQGIDHGLLTGRAQLVEVRDDGGRVALASGASGFPQVRIPANGKLCAKWNSAEPGGSPSPVLTGTEGPRRIYRALRPCSRPPLVGGCGGLLIQKFAPPRHPCSLTQ